MGKKEPEVKIEQRTSKPKKREDKAEAKTTYLTKGTSPEEKQKILKFRAERNKIS
jgi:hypothetical protein